MAPPEIITFGCRLNAAESEAMRARATALEDAVVFNTCAVTGEAVRQARQAIRKARRERPDARIVVTGCAAQIDPQSFAAMDEVDLVVGNEEKLEPALWPAARPDGKLHVGDIMASTRAAPHRLAGYAERTRAFLQVQTGCDHRCTFCTIPFGRGNSRSLAADEVVREVSGLVEHGHAEVVLTGVDMTAWGGDLEGRPRLGSLVRRILREVPGLRRLRLSSIDQVEADADLMRALAEEERLMPHLHLSLQSGDDLILKRMKRRHNRAQAVAFCAEVRRLRPDAAFGADLIAGFPTESEAMFAASEALVDDCGLVFLHVFPFSARPGTPAARMPQLDGRIVRERAARLRARGDAARDRFLGGEVGRTREVLFETPERGRTPQFAEVRVDGAEAQPGSVRAVAVSGAAGGILQGVAA